jgi:signal transduction histidine kinase
MPDQLVEMPHRESGSVLNRGNASLAGPNCNVAACLANVTALVDQIDDSRFSLELDVEPDLPEVRCNQLGLQSAILNLVFNARDAMAGAGAVLIEAEAIGAGVYMVELRVIDGGVGMTGDTIDQAFDPFFTTKSDGLGGLGLPMVEQFIRDSGGEISVDSEPGAGTTVYLRLPMFSEAAGGGSKEREQ